MSNKKYRPRGKSVCPHVNKTCADALSRFLEYELGVSEDAPTNDDCRIVTSFAKNLAYELKHYEVRREKIVAGREEVDEKFAFLERQFEEE